jgi:hypothetical protein
MMLFFLKVGASRLKQCLNEKLLLKSLKIYLDFVKTYNLKKNITYLKIKYIFNTFIYLFSNIFLVHLYDAIVSQTLHLHSCGINRCI